MEGPAALRARVGNNIRRPCCRVKAIPEYWPRIESLHFPGAEELVRKVIPQVESSGKFVRKLYTERHDLELPADRRDNVPSGHIVIRHDIGPLDGIAVDGRPVRAVHGMRATNPAHMRTGGHLIMPWVAIVPASRLDAYIIDDGLHSTRRLRTLVYEHNGRIPELVQVVERELAIRLDHPPGIVIPVGEGDICLPSATLHAYLDKYDLPVRVPEQEEILVACLGDWFRWVYDFPDRFYFWPFHAHQASLDRFHFDIGGRIVGIPADYSAILPKGDRTNVLVIAIDVFLHDRLAQGSFPGTYAVQVVPYGFNVS